MKVDVTFAIEGTTLAVEKQKQLYYPQDPMLFCQLGVEGDKSSRLRMAN